MTRRMLPPQEWAKLAGTELESVWPLLPVDRAGVLVVEDGDQIVGCWAFITQLHAEGLWIAPDKRKGTSVQRHLLRGLREIAAACGAPTVWTGSVDAQVDHLCEHVGAQELPMKNWIMSMTKGDR